MHLSIQAAIEILMWIYTIGASLLLWFSLLEEKVKDIMEKASYAVVALGIACYLIDTISNSTYYILLLFLLSIPCLKKLLNRTYSFISINVLLAFISKFLIQILINKILLCFLPYKYNYGVNILTNVLTGSILFVLSMIVLMKKIKLFPQNWQAYFSVEDNEQKKKYFRNMVTIIFTLILLSVWSAYVYDNLSKYIFIDAIYILSFSIIFFILCICFIRILIFYDMEKIETLIDKQYQGEVQAFMEVIRSQRHDFNFHLQAVSGLLNNNKYKECKEYVSSMVKDASSMNDVLPLYHPATGAMLSAFRELASGKGIQLQVLIYYDLKNIPCTVYETNKILGNLIQNAIDEVEEHPDDSKWIEVMILKRSGNSVFRVSNKICGGKDKFSKIFNSGFTTKSSHEGIGLNTVKKFTAKYEGIVYTEFEGDIIHFYVQIPNRYS